MLKLMKTLYDSVGVNTPAQGIAFSLPVDDVVGIGTSRSKTNERWNRGQISCI